MHVTVRTSAGRLVVPFLLLMAFAAAARPVSAAQPPAVTERPAAPEAGGEASLVLPDLSVVDFLNGSVNGRTLLMGGLVVTETVFTLNGLGRFVVDAILHRDIPVVQTMVLLTAFIIVFINLIVDLLYAWLDPRISYR